MRTRPSFQTARFLPLALALWMLAGFAGGCGLLSPPAAPPAPVFIPRQDTPPPATASAVAPALPEQAPISPEQPTETPEPSPRPEDYLWVVNNADHALLRIDPQSAQVDLRLPLQGRLGPAAAGAGAVWVGQSLPGGERNLLRIDPLLLQAAASIPIRQGEIFSLAAGAGAVWVGIREPLAPGSSTFAGGVLRIDPATNEANVYLPRNATTAGLVFYDQALWALEWNDVFSSIDRMEPDGLRFSTLPASVETAAFVHQFERIAINAAGIWATSVSQMSPYIYRVDPQNGAVTAAIRVAGAETDYPVELLAMEDAVWVTLHSGKVVRVDALSEQVTTQVQLKKGIGRLYATENALWVENEPEAELYQVNLLINQVVAVLSTGSKPAPTPTPTPKPKPGEPLCQSDYPSRLKEGIKAYVNEEPPVPNRVRAEPNVQAEILGQIEPGDAMLIIEGPMCVDGWVWWKVRADGSGLVGWTAEGSEKEYWLAPVE